eukprot:694592-Amphidinium_carterae.3
MSQEVRKVKVQTFPLNFWTFESLWGGVLAVHRLCCASGFWIAFVFHVRFLGVYNVSWQNGHVQVHATATAQRLQSVAMNPRAIVERIGSARESRHRLEEVTLVTCAHLPHTREIIQEKMLQLIDGELLGTSNKHLPAQRIPKLEHEKS